MTSVADPYGCEGSSEACQFVNRIGAVPNDAALAPRVICGECLPVCGRCRLYAELLVMLTLSIVLRKGHLS